MARPARTLVAGVDSSTQSCKVLVVDAADGAVVREGRASHPDGTEVAPERWWEALQSAIAEAGGLDDVAALAVGGQQHGMVCLDEDGQVVRPALLWNDTRSAGAAEDLVAELGGGSAWADAVGVVPVASITVSKLRWLAEHEPDAASRTAAVCLPHDWLTWRLLGSGALEDLATDRGDASGTGYWSAASGEYRSDLLKMALGQEAALPRVLAPAGSAGRTRAGVLLGAGTGDNAAAALGLGAGPGDVVLSVGTSGVASAVSQAAASDPAGLVAGFADATGRHLPLVCTLNASRVLDAAGRLLGVDHDGLADLVAQAAPGAGGAVLVPYLEGERTPDLPHASGSLHGLTLETTTPARVARAFVEGMWCGIAEGVDALVEQGARADRLILVGGGARSRAVREIAPTVLGRPVEVPEPGEYVARGAARQAAWALLGGDEPPAWPAPASRTVEADAAPAVRKRYAEARGLTVRRR